MARFRECRLSGFSARHHGQRPRIAPRLEARIALAAGERNADGTPRWTTRTLAEKLGVSHMTVHRAWLRLAPGDRFSRQGKRPQR